MKPGYSYATVQANIRALEQEGYSRIEAVKMAMSSARAAYFKRHPQGLLPSYLAYHHMRERKDYLPSGAVMHNPVRPLSIGERERARIQAEIDQAFSGRGDALRRAAKLYGDFTGHDDPRVFKVKTAPLPGKPRVLLVIGQLDFIGVAERPDRAYTWKGDSRPMLCASPDGKQLYVLGGYVDLPGNKTLGKVFFVGYSTVRDGEPEKYIHRFKAKARPLLRSTRDGKQLHMLGGAYDFTERGIVDR